MKLNISYPATGCQKVVEIDDENKLRAFYDKRISHEVTGDHLGDDFKGYVFKISGGNDKQGFAMKQGVLTAARVRILFRDGMSGYRIRKRGERKRKSTRGCIVSADLSVLNLVIVKKGDAEIEGLTDTQKPRRLGPKRASKIRKLFNLEKGDDVRKYVIRRQIVKDGKKPVFKAPKIQRLVTPLRLQHRRQVRAEKRRRFENTQALATEYNELVANKHKAEREAKHAQHDARKRSESRKESVKAEHKAESKDSAKAVSKAQSDAAVSTKKPATVAAGSKAAKPAATAAPQKPVPASKGATSKPAPAKEAPKKAAPTAGKKA